MYYENALFLSAQVYVKQKNKSKAKSALKKVIDLNGNLKTNAQKLLSEIR